MARDGYDFTISLMPFGIRADLDDFDVGTSNPMTFFEGLEQRTGDFDPGFITEFTSMYNSSTSEIVLTVNASIPRGSLIYVRLITANAEYRPCQTIDPTDPGEPGGPWVFPSEQPYTGSPDRITDSQNNVWTVYFVDAPFRSAEMGWLDVYDGFNWYNDPTFVGMGTYFRWKTEAELNGDTPYALACHLDEDYSWATPDGSVGAYQPAYVEGKTPGEGGREYWMFPWQAAGSWLRYGMATSRVRNDLSAGDTITIPLVKPVFNAATVLAEWQDYYGNAEDGWGEEWWQVYSQANPNGGTPQPVEWEPCPVNWAYARATAWSNLTIPLPLTVQIKDGGSFGTDPFGKYDGDPWPFGSRRQGGMCPHYVLAHPRDSGNRRGGPYHFDQCAGHNFSNVQSLPNTVIEFEIWRLWDTPGVVTLGSANPERMPWAHVPPEWNVPEDWGLSTEPPDPHHDNVNDVLGQSWPWQRSTHVLPGSDRRDGLVVDRFWARSQPIEADVQYWRYAWPRSEFEYDVMDHNLPEAEPELLGGGLYPGTPAVLRGDHRPSMYDVFTAASMLHVRVGPRLMWGTGDALSSPAASLSVHLQHENDYGTLGNEGNTGAKMTIGHSYGYGARPGDTLFAVAHTLNDANGGNDAVVSDSQGNEWICLGKTQGGIPGQYSVSFWQCDVVNSMSPATTSWPSNADSITVTSGSLFKALSVFCFDHVEGALAYVPSAYCTNSGALWTTGWTPGTGWKGNVPIAREIDSLRGHTVFYIHAGHGQPWSEYSNLPHSILANSPEPAWGTSDAHANYLTPVCHFTHRLLDGESPGHDRSFEANTTISMATNHGNNRFWIRNQITPPPTAPAPTGIQVGSGHLIISDHGQFYGASHGSSSGGGFMLVRDLGDSTEVTERMPVDSGPVVLGHSDDIAPGHEIPRSVEPIDYEGDAIYCGPF